MQSSSRNPAASGLLSVQAELRKRQKAAASSSDSASASASRSSSKESQADEYNLKAFKGKKLSSDFVTPREGTNYDSSEPSHKRRKIKPDPILDKYRIKGRDPNAAIYSATAKTPSAKLEAERLKVLRAKAKAYESLSTKQSHDDEQSNDDDPDGGLIDFRRKAAELQYDDEDNRQSGDLSDDEHVDRAEKEEEEMITYVDELGRTRAAPRSEVPPELLPENNQDSSSSSALPLAYGRQTAFPIYRPPSPKLSAARAIRREVESGEPPKRTHFDPKAEVRNRGAGLFQFAKDEKERQTQMEALQRERARTERERLSRLGAGADGTHGSSSLAQQGFASAEDRPWGGEEHDYEEGGLDPDAYEDDHRIRQREMNAATARGNSTAESRQPSTSAPVLDPFAAVELAAAQQKKRKKD